MPTKDKPNSEKVRGTLDENKAFDDPATRSTVAKTLQQSFPYVRVYGSLEHWGNHFLASEQPIPDLTPQQLVARMPAAAVTDMMEWDLQSTPQQQFAAVLNTRTTLDQLIAEAPDLPPLTDDRPINEYYLLRRADPALLHKSY